ncbi:hypothetical protein [Dickeya lacustris]|uniref:Uncharacterized protein n=1 Tax=Dickeya lacustris TaxID=2259638 RepID=A0ABY8G4C0_9GAMM|nr:hypothetical protein [Dickeya lacustris]WFN54773.1 hypothetical protein O1Q98_14060 [Dickeya lacustris]
MALIMDAFNGDGKPFFMPYVLFDDYVASIPPHSMAHHTQVYLALPYCAYLSAHLYAVATAIGYLFRADREIPCSP